MSDTEKALVEKYRGTSDYGDGYADGLNGRPIGFICEAYDVGHRAGVRAASLFAAHGMKRTADGAFTISGLANPATSS